MGCCVCRVTHKIVFDDSVKRYLNGAMSVSFTQGHPYLPHPPCSERLPAYGKGFVYFRVLSVDSEGPSLDGATAGK